MRTLTSQEIEILSANGCFADDWQQIQVTDPFDVRRVRGVNFCGRIELGSNAGQIEVVDGFKRPCGLRNVTLSNVRIGNDSLVEDTTLIACTVADGEDLVIPVLNEAGDGNVLLSPQLTSQLAAM